MECHADRLFDLAFAPYRPLRPTAGKDRVETLLWAALAAAGEREVWEGALLAVQREFGGGRTIWGASLRGGRPVWTLRIANPGHERLVDALRRALGPWLTIAPALVDYGDYEVLGLELDDAAAAGRVEAVNLHIRGPGPSERQVWRSDGERRDLVEEVLVVEAKREITAALRRIKASPAVNFHEDRHLLGRVLLPELFACRHLHVVRRVDADALVFSGLNVDQLGWFLDRFGHAPEIRERTVAGRKRLDHLLFDVEVAYRQEGATIVYPETTFYGAL